MTAGGFRPVRTLDGLNCFPTIRKPKGTGATDKELIYVGDVVGLNADGSVSRIVATDVSATGIARPVFGVVAAVFKDEAGTPYTHSLPTKHPNISNSADADWLDVYYGDNIVYLANIDTSAAFSLTGQAVGIKVTARTTASGISGMMIDASVSASSFNPFKILGIADTELVTNAGSSTGYVEVIPNYSFSKSTNTF